jgi:hypothetical protein
MRYNTTQSRTVILGCVALCTALAISVAANAEKRATWINPLDIDYKYDFTLEHDGVSFRTGADPTVVRHKDAYYLFMTKADGYWRSTDLLRWHFIPAVRWPFEGNVAPTAVSDGDKLYIMQSSFGPRPLLSTTNPAAGAIDFEERMMAKLPDSVPAGQEDRVGPGQIPPGPWDPDLFRDDDGRWYLYWGSSNLYPIYGIEIDPSKHWDYIGKPTPLITAHPDLHGWERFGQDHRDENTRPYAEGAWMTKHDGRYYLQYAAPGTEHNVYANGVYVGDSPLGPFTYAPYNPISYKPGGYATGAGHGSTFQDRLGNWWNTGTTWIGNNWNFERRIVQSPAGFTPDGQMYASTRFGDFPHWAATSRVTNPDDLFTGWMLLSYHKPATASSTRAGFDAKNVTDEDPHTYWVAARNAAGETLTVDLGAVMTVHAVQVNFADYQSALFGDSSEIWTAFNLLGSKDGKHWVAIGVVPALEHRDRPNAYVQLPVPARVRYVRYDHMHVGAANLAISDIRVFGKADGKAPLTPQIVDAAHEADTRNAVIRWTAIPSAIGYNIRWGLRPDRLYQTQQVWAGKDPLVELRALTAGQSYWVAIEAFNETGVSELSRPVLMR